MADSSFDIVSKVDRQEVDNALNQAAKELSQRFDFRNTGAQIEWNGELGVELTANTEERVSAARGIQRTSSSSARSLSRLSKSTNQGYLGRRARFRRDSRPGSLRNKPRNSAR